MRNEFVRHPAKAGVFRFASGSWVALACVAFALLMVASAGCAKKPTAADAPAPQAAAAPDADADAEAAADAANAVGAPMPCAALTAARYPFLTCVRGESGGPVLAAVGPGQELHQMKIPSKFVSGDGYWGPSDLD